MAKEYIERDTALEIIETSIPRWGMMAVLIDINEARDALNEAPAADVVEVKHGEWISDDADILFHCSECDTQVSTSWDYESDWDYCPNCGAKMDGKRREK